MAGNLATAERDEVVTPDELAAELKIARGTIYTWRRRKQGPKAFKAGGALRFYRSDIQAWIAAGGGTAPPSA